MRLVDARRLTGPSFLARTPLVIVEIALDEGDTLDACLAAYREELGRMREAIGWPRDARMLVHPHRGGGVCGYETSIDVMLAAAEMSEWAGESAAARLAGHAPLDLEPKLAAVAEILARDESPTMLALHA